MALAALLAWGVASATVEGQPPTTDLAAAAVPATEEITRDVVLERLKAVEESQVLTEDAKAKLRQQYGEALGELDRASRRLADAATFEQMIVSAPEQLGSVGEELAALPSEATVVEPTGADLAQLDQKLNDAQDAVATAKQTLADLEAEPKRRASRRKEIPSLLGADRDEMAKISQGLLTAEQQPDSSPEALAERTLRLARRQRLAQDVHALEQETAAYDATPELLRQQRDLAAARLALAEQTETQWREIVNRRTKEQAEDKTKSALEEARQVEETLPALRPLADATHADAVESEKASGDALAASAELQKVQAFLDRVTREYARTRERVDAAGLSYAIGSLLRSQRTSLPDVEHHERARRARQSEIRSTQLRLFELDDRRSDMANLEGQIQAEMRRLGPLPEGMTAADVEPLVRDLLSKQRDQLDALIRNYDKYFETLVDLDEAEQLLVRKTREYADYIDERVFWIGSAAPLQLSDARSAGAALAWLASPGNWVGLVDAGVLDARSQPALNLLLILLLAVLVWKQRRLRAVLGKTAELARQRSLCRITPTVEALLATVLIAAVWPAVMWYVGWRLAGSLSASEFVVAVAAGLMHAAVVLLPLELARQVCRRDGLGEAHFGWPTAAVAMIRTNLRWFTPSVLPLVLVVATLQAQDNRSFDNSLGRICSIATFLLMAVVFHRIFRPSGDFFRQVLAHDDDSWLYRLRHVWYLLGVLSPLVLALISGLGYNYTALQLSARLRQTLCVPLVLAIVGAFLLRWVLVVRRRLAIERFRQKAAAEPSDATAEAPAQSEPQVDLAAVSEQTRRLIRVLLVVVGVLGVWYIWVDALPALGILEKVTVWPPGVWGVAPVAAGGQTGLTLADLALAGLVIAVTLIAARNVSGLLQIAVLEHLPLDAGARYAVATVSRYAILVLGIVLACGAVGVHWSTVQWLVAAVSVGLGFGLQEVFANFVCGLILLFERPIRVGDIVTVEDVTGMVSRIQIRATTVTDWDHKEFIVPNKEFITGRLLNWTLTNRVNRVVIPVGVAYGSDTSRATERLLQIARRHPDVLDDPPPLATFEGFGDSTLNLVLRCYLPNLDRRLAVIHELHTEINRVFADERIEIAFPQRDVHLHYPPGFLPESGGDPIERPRPRADRESPR